MKTTSILMLAAALAAATSCTNPTKEIEAAAQGYLDAMGNYRIDDAAPYASRETREKTIPTFNFIMAHTDTAYVNSNRPATITIGSTRMLSDTTARVYYHKSTPIKEVDDSVNVILEEGQWLVDFVAVLPPMKAPDKLTRKAVDPSTIHRIAVDSIDKDKLLSHKQQSR